MNNLIGKSLDRYHILEQLGEGGMAVVYKAYDTRLERDVAVKIIRKGAFPPDQIERILKRFEREAKALARLSHSNIIKILDYGEYESSPYLVMEYLPGGTLKQKMGKPLSWHEAIQLLLPIAEALDYAHSQNMIHRDVKPANILLTQRGQPMLTDFGIAKVLDLEETLDLTGTSAAVGTPEYMAPEQATAKYVDHRADIYSLGVVLYEMVTGRKPFIADTPMAVLIKHATEALPHPTQFAPSLPDEVEKILLKVLAKQPENRYQDMGELVSAFKGALAGKVPVEKADRDRKERDAAERVERERKEKEAHGKQAHEVIAGAKQGKEKREKAIPKKKEDKPVASKPKASGQTTYWLGGFALLILGIVLFYSLNNPLQQPEPTPTNTQLQEISTSNTEAIEPSVTSMPKSTSTPVSRVTSTPLPAEITDAREVSMMLVSDSVAQAFYMDKYEITNALYKICVDAEICVMPEIANRYVLENYVNHPVTYVDQNMAITFCQWRDARLPTEVEWKSAVRGVKQGCDYANLGDYVWGWGWKHGCAYSTLPVGSHELGMSDFNIYDLIGNVREWIKGTLSGKEGGVIGGSYKTDNLQIAYTNSLDAIDPDIGFRCVRDVAP